MAHPNGSFLREVHGLFCFFKRNSLILFAVINIILAYSCVEKGDAGTTRLADEYMIRELMFEGSNRCFDQSICMDLQVTDQDIDALCHALKAVAIKNVANDEQKAAVKDVTKRQLLSWGVLVEKEGAIYPTNAYAVLTGSEAIPVVIQCGVFKGKTKAVFVDRREFSGPLYEQIEQAYQFVLRNIRLGATFNGLYRQDVYEIPTDAIRELIINAAVHRSYLDRGNIQVAIYDDRLEVTSPGKLPIGQTVERMKEGYSKIRNEALANAFSYMNLIEHWGSGIPRIIERVKAAGLREPEFIDGDIDLRINIYRVQIDLEKKALGGEAEQKASNVNDGDGDGDGEKTELNENERSVYAQICVNASITAASIAKELGISKATVERTIRSLKEREYIVREGGARNGKWVTKK